MPTRQEREQERAAKRLAKEMAAEALAATKKTKAETKSLRVETVFGCRSSAVKASEDTWEDGTVDMPLKRAGQLWGATGKEDGGKGATSERRRYAVPRHGGEAHPREVAAQTGRQVVLAPEILPGLGPLAHGGTNGLEPCRVYGHRPNSLGQ